MALTFTPRPYQTDGVNDIARAWAAGHKRVIYALTAGGGKSSVFCMVTERALGNGATMMVMAHRRQLVKQLAERLQLFGIPYRVEMSNLPDEPWVRQDSNPRVYVASKDTLLSRCRGNRWDNIPASDLLTIDECVTGDTVVVTEHGRIRIDEIPSKRSQHVLSDGPLGPRYRRILKFMRRGVKPCLRITLKNRATLTCTGNHPVMTQRGWVEAGNLLTTDLVKCSAGAGAGLGWDAVSTGGTTGSLAGTSCSSIRRSETSPFSIDGVASGTHWSPRSITASAGAGCGSFLPLGHSRSSARSNTVRTSGSPRGTRTGPRTGTLNSLTPNDPVSSGHCLATQACCTRTPEAVHQGCHSIIPSSRPSGRGTSSPFWLAWTGESGCITTRPGTEVRYSTPAPHAFSAWCRCTSCATWAARNGSLTSGWTDSAISAWPSGSATTVACPGVRWHCTPKASVEVMSSWPLGGSNGSMGPALSRHRGVTTTSASTRSLKETCTVRCGTLSRSACDTNWSPVAEVSRTAGGHETYDLEVEDDHNFYANGMLVHNCHHVEQAEFSELVRHCPAKWWLGLTATPMRPDGSGLGSNNWDHIVTGPSFRSLQEQGFLVPLQVFDAKGLGARRKRGDKTTGIAGDPLGHWKRLAEGRPTLGFTRDVAESRHLAAEFENAGIPAAFLCADSSFEERTDVLGRLADGKLLWVGNAYLLGEGVDIPELGCIQLLRKCGRLRDFIQVVSRVVRSCERIGKTDGILLDHAGAYAEHRYPEIEFEWRLDESAAQFKKRVKEKKGDLKQAVACQNCGCVFAGRPTCPHCGTPIPPSRKRRKPIIERELLSAVGCEAGRERKSQLQRVWDRVLAIAKAKDWAIRRANAMFRSECGVYPEQAGVFPVFRFDDRDRLVEEMLGNRPRV